MPTLFLIVFVDLVGFGLVIPLLPFYAERFTASPLQMTALFATFSWTFVEKPALQLRQALPQVARLTAAVPRRAVT